MGKEKSDRLNSYSANSQKHIFESITGLNFMDSKLIVKNFGPIKEVELHLKNVNVFIGQQASGKSALAKLYTIFKAPRKFFESKNEGEEISSTFSDDMEMDFKKVLKEYNIDSFLDSQTEVEFESELHKI